MPPPIHVASVQSVHDYATAYSVPMPAGAADQDVYYLLWAVTTEGEPFQLSLTFPGGQAWRWRHSFYSDPGADGERLFFVVYEWRQPVAGDYGTLEVELNSRNPQRSVFNVHLWRDAADLLSTFPTPNVDNEINPLVPTVQPGGTGDDEFSRLAVLLWEDVAFSDWPAAYSVGEVANFSSGSDLEPELIGNLSDHYSGSLNRINYPIGTQSNDLVFIMLATDTDATNVTVRDYNALFQSGNLSVWALLLDFTPAEFQTIRIDGPTHAGAWSIWTLRGGSFADITVGTDSSGTGSAADVENPPEPARNYFTISACYADGAATGGLFDTWPGTEPNENRAELEGGTNLGFARSDIIVPGLPQPTLEQYVLSESRNWQTIRAAIPGRLGESFGLASSANPPALIGDDPHTGVRFALAAAGGFSSVSYLITYREKLTGRTATIPRRNYSCNCCVDFTEDCNAIRFYDHTFVNQSPFWNPQLYPFRGSYYLRPIRGLALENGPATQNELFSAIMRTSRNDATSGDSMQLFPGHMAERSFRAEQMGFGYRPPSVPFTWDPGWFAAVIWQWIDADNFFGLEVINMALDASNLLTYQTRPIEVSGGTKTPGNPRWHSVQYQFGAPVRVDLPIPVQAAVGHDGTSRVAHTHVHDPNNAPLDPQIVDRVVLDDFSGSYVDAPTGFGYWTNVDGIGLIHSQIAGFGGTGSGIGLLGREPDGSNDCPDLGRYFHDMERKFTPDRAQITIEWEPSWVPLDPPLIIPDIYLGQGYANYPIETIWGPTTVNIGWEIASGQAGWSGTGGDPRDFHILVNIIEFGSTTAQRFWMNWDHDSPGFVPPTMFGETFNLGNSYPGRPARSVEVQFYAQ